MHQYPGHAGNGNSCRRKGFAAEAFQLPGLKGWAVGKYPPDCHKLWSAIILGLAMCLFP